MATSRSPFGNAAVAVECVAPLQAAFGPVPVPPEPLALLPPLPPVPIVVLPARPPLAPPPGLLAPPLAAASFVELVSRLLEHDTIAHVTSAIRDDEAASSSYLRVGPE